MGKPSLHELLGPQLSHRIAWLLIPFMGIAWITFAWALDERTRPLILNTVLLSGATCALALPTAFGLAWLVSRTDVRGRHLFIAALFVSLFLPLYLQLTGWHAGLGQQGWLQSWTGTLATPPVLAGWRGAIWVHTAASVPWAALIFIVGLESVPAEWEDAALLETGWLRTLWHVTRPATRPAWTVAAVWVFASTAGEMTVTDVYRIRTFAEEVFLAFALGDPQSVASMAVPSANASSASPVRPTLVFGGGLTLWLVYAMIMSLRAWLPAPHAVRPQKRARWASAPHSALPGALLTCAAIVLWGIPIGNLLFNAGLVISLRETTLVRHWSGQKCLEVVMQSPSQFRGEFAWSFACANLTAFAATAVALPVTWWARSRPGGAIVMIGAIAVCLVVPGPVVGLAIIKLLNHDAPLFRYLYDRTLLAPCLAMTVRALPLVMLIMWQAFRSLPEAILDAARLDGASRVRLVLSIVLPQRKLALLAAWLVAMAIAIGELAATVLVAPPGVNTLAISIFGLVHYGVDDRLAGLCLSLLLLCIATGAAGYVALRIRRQGYTRD